jgi:hypothetical protein
MAISPGQTLNGKVGVAFSQTPAHSGTILSWTGSGLPTGLSINATTGAITGTPTTAATTIATFIQDKQTFVDFAATETVSFGLRNDGSVFAFGRNVSEHFEPAAGIDVLDGITAISAGEGHAFALKSDGTVFGWGNTTLGAATVPPSLTGVTAISAGRVLGHCLALKSNGTVVAWGHNEYGEATVPPSLTGVTAISAGLNFSLALKSNGTVVGWGRNDAGQATIPSGLTGVIAISAGYSHALALKSDGTVVAWGLNTSGQTTVPASATGVTSISAGGYFSLAEKSNGTVIAWGNNSQGQCNIPTDVVSPAKLSAGGFYSLALNNNGDGIGWPLAGGGYNYNNQHGQATAPRNPDPVTIQFVIAYGTPIITTPIQFTGLIGSAFVGAASLEDSVNRPATSWTCTALPSWATFNASAGTITGTPLDAFSGSITLTATGIGGTSAQATGTITIAALLPPTITAGQSFTGKVGVAFSQTPALTNASTRPATSWAIASGALPAGLSLNATTGAITGTPTAIVTSAPDLRATGPGGTSANQSVSFVVGAGVPIISAGQSITGTVGTALSGFINLTDATNRPVTSWAATGLPAGLSLNAATGAVTGTPTTAATSTAAVTATGTGGSSTTNVSFTISASGGGGGGGGGATTPSLMLADNQSFTATLGAPFTQTPSLLSGTAVKWYASGLPQWATINATTGAITGTPTISGATSISLTATDASNATSTAQLSLNVVNWSVLEIFVDVRNRKILSKADTKFTLAKMTLKRDDRLPFRIVFVEGTSSFAIPSSFSVSVGIKASYSSTEYLAFSASSSGTIDLSSDVIAALFSTGQEKVAAIFEVKWEDTTSAFRTITLPAEIQNSVIIGNALSAVAYMGADTNPFPATNSLTVRNIGSPSFGVAKGKVYPIVVKPGDRRITIAIPASLGEINSIFYAEFLDANVLDTFDGAMVPVSVAGGTTVNYNVFTYIAAVPFSNFATYVVTI